MGIHEAYGRQVLRLATKNIAMPDELTRKFKFGSAYGGCIDATVGNIAIEVEARTPKQVRGAVVDLIFHPFPQKLLLLVPVAAVGNPKKTADHCRFIMTRLCPTTPFRAVVLEGTGDNHRLAADTAIVADALCDLGWSSAA